VFVGGQVRDTSFRASSQTLIRGGSVPFTVCGSAQVTLPSQSTSLRVLPTPVFRADSVTLVHGQLPNVGVLGAADAAVSAVAVSRDSRGTPRSLELPSRAGQTLLTLPQNINDGWTASLDGTELTSVRVDGWKQGWMVPAGAAGTVELRFAPGTPFVVLLALGALGAFAVLLIWAWPRRGRHGGPGAARVELPPLSAGSGGALDAVVAVVAGGLLVGWWGVAGVVAAIALGRLLRRFAAWAWMAGLALLVGGLALGWDWLTRQSWVVTWSQAWTLAAVCLLVASLARATRRGDGDISPLE
jgi:arabinofuranan 3-O-arabinosyltransferase